MEKYNHEMKRILELTETMEEGLIHIRNQVNDGYFEASIPLVQDTISVFSSIEKSLFTFESNHLKEELEDVFRNVR